jgi:putative ABC transport system permease protein
VTLAANATPQPDARLAVVLVALVGLAVAASYLGGLGVERSQVTAAVRAVLQLGVVSLVIAAALQSLLWSTAFVGLMFLVASVTSAQRLDVPRRQWSWVMLAVAAGAAPVLALVIGSGVVPLNGPGVLPIAGIVIGNTMTAATLTGRRAFDEIHGQFGSYEAGLALGLTSP